MKPSFIALIFVLCHGIALGELQWDRQRVELTPGPVDTFVDATFGFVNAGTEQVTIEKIEPSCGCTTATLPKMTFEPGERSQLVTRFDLTGRRGLQTKTMTVHIKGAKTPVILTLVVTIPDLMKILPPLVVWGKGEAARPKTIALQALEGQPVKVVEMLSSHIQLRAKLNTIEESRNYAITVTPVSTSEPSFSVLTIYVEYKGEKRALRAYAQVKDAPQ